MFQKGNNKTQQKYGNHPHQGHQYGRQGKNPIIYPYQQREDKNPRTEQQTGPTDQIQKKT